MSTGTKTYTRAYGISANSSMTLSFNTAWSLPSGTTYSRAKVTKTNASSDLQWTCIGGSWNKYKWDTYYGASDNVTENSLKYNGNAAIRIKSQLGSYANSTYTLTVEYTYPNRTITVSAGTGGTASANKSSAGYGDSVTLTATPSTGYSFNKWTTTGGTLASSTSASTTLTMPDANVTVTASFKINSYTLTTAVSPSGYGTVTAGTSMNYNAKKQLTATPSTGRKFSSWSKTAGTLSSTSANPTTFTMGAGAATVTANFATQSYTLTVSKGTGIGSVSGGGANKAYGSSNAISATASSGYTFKNWTSNNGGSFNNANSASTSFTMPAGNVTVTANATVNSYTLTVSKGTGISSVTGGGANKAYGSSNAISATASTGYTFKNWTSNNGGSFNNANSASTSFTMPAGNVTVTANANINTYTLTTAVSPNGGGTVTSGASMTYNSKKQLTATASTGYSFSSWSKTAGTLSSTTTNPTTFTIAAGNATVTANFAINTYTLTTAVSPSGGGTVTAGAQMTYNSNKQLTATAADGYTFSSWSATAGTLSSTSTNPTTFTIGAGAATVTASFSINTYTLTVEASPSGGGTVTGSGLFVYGSTNSITATPATGYQFDGWTTTSGTLGDATSASTTLTMSSSNATTTATFSKIDYTITTDVDPAGSGTLVSDVATANYGDTVTLTPTPEVGYAFDSWITSPTLTIENNQFTMPAENVSITAVFYLMGEEVEVVPSSSVYGTTTGSGYYVEGTTITITATPNSGYHFTSWSTTAGTITDPDSAETTFVVPEGGATITASFGVNQYTIGIQVSPEGTGSATGAGTYNYNSTVEISATPFVGCSFVEWSCDNGTITDTSSATTTYTVPASDDTIYATFVDTRTKVYSGNITWTTGDGYITINCNMINTTTTSGQTTMPGTLKIKLGAKA